MKLVILGGFVFLGGCIFLALGFSSISSTHGLEGLGSLLMIIGGLMGISGQFIKDNHHTK